MPADCQVPFGNDLCGVIAIGRCVCGKAFCTSHQALGPNGVLILNRCTTCEYVATTETAQKASDAGARLSDAIDALPTSGIPRVELYTRPQSQKRSLLGLSHGPGTVFGSGWVVGQLPWSYYPPGIRSDSVRGPWLSALVDRRSSSRQQDNLVRVELRPGGVGYFVLDGVLGLLESEHLAEQLEELVA